MDKGSDIEQEEGIKTIPKKNKCKKERSLSDKALQIAEKRREAKGKGEKERYTHLNQFSSVAQSCLTFCNPMDCSRPGLPVHQKYPEFTQTHVHWVGDAIQPSHPQSSPSLPTFNLSQDQSLFQRVSSSQQVARVLEFQLQHQSFQWIFRINFL